MSDDAQDMRDEYLAKIRRSNAETEKFIAEQRKLIEESQKLAAERRKLEAEAEKFRREKTTLVLTAGAALAVASGAAFGLLLKLFGH